ncbi:MAG: hypothetical protein JWQ07_4741 [Ramlibacter sp.]|nr:hypothetical protein [Ramlibacter sp.]
MNVDRAVAQLDWESIERQLDDEGHSVLPRFLSQRVADGLRHLAEAQQARLTAEDDFGNGRLFYLPRDLPSILGEMRASFYRRLAPVANR